MTKVRVCKVASQERSPGITFSAFESAKKCEGMNPHTPKWTLILEVRIPNGFMNVQRAIARGQNPSVQKVFYIIGNLLKWRCLKWVCITHLDIWNTSYDQKKGWESTRNQPGIKLVIWFPIIKTQESTRFPRVQVAWNIPLKSFQQGLQLCFRPHCN